MALRIHDYVIKGELINTRSNSTHGWMEMSGAPMPVTFELTGDCAEDLRGLHIRFEANPAPSKRTRREFRALALAPSQIGPTGVMTAAGWVRTFECSVEEYCRRARLGEAPPTTWKRRLYLNWFSQNGEVTLELAGPKIEYLDGEAWKPLPAPEPSPVQNEEAQTAGLPEPCGYDVARELTEGAASPAEALQRELDAQARAIERAIRGQAPSDESEDDDAEEELAQDMAEMELLDDLMDFGEEVPLVDIFEERRRFPDPDRLSEEQADVVLKDLLRQLALCNVAFHICEHYTPRQAYRLLIEKVFQEGRVFKQLRGTAWVTNFMTSEYCKACEEEWERNFALRKEPDGNEAAGEV